MLSTLSHADRVGKSPGDLTGLSSSEEATPPHPEKRKDVTTSFPSRGAGVATLSKHQMNKHWKALET
jgi:hypothetical protein